MEVNSGKPGKEAAAMDDMIYVLITKDNGRIEAILTDTKYTKAMVRKEWEGEFIALIPFHKDELRISGSDCDVQALKEMFTAVRGIALQDCHFHDILNQIITKVVVRMMKK